MQKILLAAAAVVTLAAPAVSMAQPYGGYNGGYNGGYSGSYNGGYHEGWREAPRYETSWRYDNRRAEALREQRWEREREWRASHWRAEHRGYYGYRPY